MAFTSVEIIALILIIFSAIKILILLINPKSWMNFAKSILGGKWLSGIIMLILAAVILFYLLQEITIVQILAVIAFVALFMGLGFVGHAKDFIKIYEKQIKGKSIWKNGMWLYTLLWVALLVWGCIVLFS